VNEMIELTAGLQSGGTDDEKGREARTSLRLPPVAPRPEKGTAAAVEWPAAGCSADDVEALMLRLRTQRADMEPPVTSWRADMLLRVARHRLLWAK
jgi:hypothetical protein